MEICAQPIPLSDFNQYNGRRVGKGRLGGLASTHRPSNELPIGFNVISDLFHEMLSPKSLQGNKELRSVQEKNASILKTDSIKLEKDFHLSNGFQRMENYLPKEKSCIDGIRNIDKKDACFLFKSKNGKRGRCGDGGRQSEISLCGSGNGVIILENGESNEIHKSKIIPTAVSNDNCILSDTSNSDFEDNGFHRISYHPTIIACRAGYGKAKLTEDISNSVQKMEENAHASEPENLGNVFLDEHQTLPLWVKWRGKWQTGFRCPTADCPLSTLRAKPTHERKKYISIFFPRTRTYSWVDMLLVCPIDEFPEPLAYGTHRRWRKLVKDLSTPRRYIMQKLAVAMLNISDQLHTEAVIEEARKTITWKDFAMEASRCRAYPNLGKMLLKLQKMILPHYISKDWLESSFDYWVQRCCNAPNAETIENLTGELMESVLWSEVDELWNAPVQPELGPEWKSWKQEAMKWFFASKSGATIQDEYNSSDISVKGKPQTSQKRVKLEIRRPEYSGSKMDVSDFPRPSHIKSLYNNCGHDSSDLELPLNCESHKMTSLPRVTVAASGSGNMLDSKDEVLQSAVSTSEESLWRKKLILHAPDQSNSSSRYRQCLAFIEAKGRQCGRWANDGDIYCCVHLTFHSVQKRSQNYQMLSVEAPMCQGTTTRGNKCKHRARFNSTFCKKHFFQGDRSSVTADTFLLSPANTSKREQLDDLVPENLSSSNATSGQEVSLVREASSSAKESLIPGTVEETLDERDCIMKQSKLHNSMPSVNNFSSETQQCIGHYGYINGGQCHGFPKRHSLYCEKHIPRFLKRARNGKSRLISKDIFISLLKGCFSRKQKLCLHQACELLYGFLKSGLSCQKYLSRGDSMAWILAEVSKDANVGEYLLKLVTNERERIMGLWGFNCDFDKQASYKEIKSLSTMNKDPQIILKCKICAESFSDDYMLTRHWTGAHKKEARWLFKGYACTVCMCPFTSRKVLETHVIEKHGVQFLENSLVVRCVSCSSHFTTPEKLWQHVFSLHLTELKLPDFSQTDCNISEDRAAQATIGTTIKLCKNKNVLEKNVSRKYICRFCGLKFDRLPDIGRHHQFAHMVPYSANRFSSNRRNYFSSKRRNYFFKCSKSSHSKFLKNIGSTFRFNNHSNRLTLGNIQPDCSASQVSSKFCKQPSEVVDFAELSESSCYNVAEALSSKIRRTKQRPNNLEILSFARTACCRTNFDAALVEYEVLPKNIYLKAAKLCSEHNIQVSWHQEEFICPKGCKPIAKPYLLAPLKSLPYSNVDLSKLKFNIDVKWEMDECHCILGAEHFDRKPRQDSIVLCGDVSFGKEKIPVVCVVDEDLKHLLTINVREESCTQKSWLSMLSMSYTYATERLIDPSLGLDSMSSQLGCACPPQKCFPENCDHVYLFDNDNDTAVDIHGKLMQGRFPYDDQGRILLEEGHLVYECNSMCSCDMTCKNRVLQKGIQIKLEIFRTEKKGWAVRAGEAVARGTFVCECIGVLRPSGEHERTQSIECSYVYDVDAHFDGLRCLSEGTVPCVIDATEYGNVSRFINHSCDPNLVNYMVLIESMDCQLAHIGLFAKRDIALGEELAFDYSRSKGLQGERLCCYCAASCCRGWVY